MVTASTGVSSAQGSSIQGAVEQQLGKDVFLKLLITELKSQDPLRPMEDKEFIAQLAQFSTLEQMQVMNAKLETFVQNQFSFGILNLVGREIEAKGTTGGDEVIRGRVESILYDSGTPLLKIEGRQDGIPLSSLLRVS